MHKAELTSSETAFKLLVSSFLRRQRRAQKQQPRQNKSVRQKMIILFQFLLLKITQVH